MQQASEVNKLGPTYLSSYVVVLDEQGVNLWCCILYSMLLKHSKLSCRVCKCYM